MLGCCETLLDAGVAAWNWQCVSVKVTCSSSLYKVNVYLNSAKLIVIQHD